MTTFEAVKPLEPGKAVEVFERDENGFLCLLYTSPSPRDPKTSRMPSSA